MAVHLIYSTFPDKQSALAAAETLLGEALIACANLAEGVTSVYRWQGEMQQQAEVILIAKTSETQAESAIARLQALHPYELPCIVHWPVAGGLPAFLGWVEAETDQ